MDRAQITAALVERWTHARERDDRFLLAVAIALAVHMTPLVAVTGGWWGLGQPAEMTTGDAAGSKDGINVEVIDAAEFDKRYVSFGKGQDHSDSEPARASPEQQPVQRQDAAEPMKQQEPSEQQEPKDKQEAQRQSEPPPADARPEPALRPSLPPTPPPKQKTAPSQQFTEREIAEIVQSARQDFQDAVLSSSSASEARLGQASEYVRGIFRLLKQTMPKSSGTKGVVRIGLILADDGSIAWLGVLRSSGSPELDRMVIERIRTTRYPPPPRNAPMRERKFQVSYEYQ